MTLSGSFFRFVSCLRFKRPLERRRRKQEIDESKVLQGGEEMVADLGKKKKS